MKSELDELRKRIDVLDTRISVEQRTIHTIMTEMAGLWDALAALERDRKSKGL